VRFIFMKLQGTRNTGEVHLHETSRDKKYR